MNSSRTLTDCLIEVLIIFDVKNVALLHDGRSNFRISQLEHVGISYFVQNILFKLSRPMRYDCLLIDARSVNDIRQSLETLFWSRSWNRNALVVLTGVDVALLEILAVMWQFYILKVVILKGGSFYTYRPITVSKCSSDSLQPEFICNCSDAMPLKALMKYDSNISYYTGCTIRVASVRVSPYVMGDGTEGTESLLTQEIARRTRVNYKFVSHNFQHHGELVNGSVTKMYGMLWRRQIEIVFGAPKAEPYLLEWFQGTQTTYVLRLAFFVPSADLMSVSEQLARIFSKQLWFVILTTQLVIMIVLYVYTLLRKGKHNISDYFFKALNVSLNGYHIRFKSPVLNILFFDWAVLSMFLMMLFTNTFMVFLTKPNNNHQISSLDEIADSHLRVGGYSINRELFKTDPKIYNRWENCTLQSDECLEYVLEGKFVLLKSIDTIRYQMKAKNNSNIFECKPMLFSFLWLLTTRGFPMYDRLNELILRMHENGLTVKWIRDTMSQANEPRFTKKMVIKYHIGFNILAVGYVLAILSFFGEKLSYSLTLRPQ